MRHLITIGAILIALFVPHIGMADLPTPAGFVNDYAGVIDAGMKNRMESILTAVERKTGVEIAVVTISSLDERPIEDYAVDLYENWGIGKKGVDEGALILVAPAEKRVRIEVGYGLEGALNDARAGRIIRELMIPAFKKGDFTRGIAAGTQAVVGIALKEKGVSPDQLGEAATASIRTAAKKKGGPLSVIFKIIIAIGMIYLFIRHPWLFLFFLASMGGRGGGGGRGGFSSGFGGFGGGVSGGGGASGGW